MITGREIRRARQAHGLTQQEFADQLGVSLRSVGNWERNVRVPQNREGAIRAFLDSDSQKEPISATVRIDQFSDMELVAELMRRLAERTRRGQAADPLSPISAGDDLPNET